MATVSARIDVAAGAAQAEAAWLDVARWPLWVDGLRSVVSVSPQWPAPGAVVEWDSHPGGRGRVAERVVEREPGAGLALAVEDEAVTGRQAVAFDPLPSGAGTRITLTLAYGVRRRSPLTPLVDAIFIRRSQRESLERTLLRFAQELTAAPPDAVL